MSEKKRTTVTTIETHEVWVIRNAAVGPPGGSVAIKSVETPRPSAVIPLPATLNRLSEASTEKKEEQEQ